MDAAARRAALMGHSLAVVCCTVALVTSACGGGDGAPASAPPPKGPATVFGKVTRNGQPVVRIDVSLSPKRKGQKGRDVKTNAQGAFRVRRVKPGRYELFTGMFVETNEAPAFSPVSLDDPCTAAGFSVLAVYGTSRKTGKQGFLAQASSKTAIVVAAGAQLEKNVAFACE